VVIRQNRAVPILLVLTFAFILYLAGCFGSEEPITVADDTPTPVATATVPPVVSPSVEFQSDEEPFFHTVEEGDRLGTIASKYSVSNDVILRANPGLDGNVLIVGQTLRIPGATTNNETFVEAGPDRPDGVTVDYVVQPNDTLGGIANVWTVDLDALIEANPGVDANALQVNDLLVIPPWGTGIDPADLQPRTTPVPIQRSPNDPPIEHTVAAGDFISAIAELYSVTSSQIVDLNDLPNAGNDIQIGQVLLIPPPLADETEDDNSDNQADADTSIEAEDPASE